MVVAVGGELVLTVGAEGRFGDVVMVALGGLKSECRCVSELFAVNLARA
jgi:hypothetical protein